MLPDRKLLVWSWIICSTILEISGRGEMSLKFLGQFWDQRLIFATLHLSGKEANLIERLQILTIGAQSIFKPSLRNFSARLSTPVALLVLNSFVFRTNTELTFSNLSCFFREVKSFVYSGALKVLQIFL